MDAGDANIPDAFDAIAHRLRRQRRFLRDRYVAGARGHHRNLANAAFGVISLNSYQPRRLMPLGFSDYVSHFAKRSFISMRDENIRSMLNQTLNYADNLFARLAGAKHNFGKALARRTRMIHARVADVFVVKISYRLAASLCEFARQAAISISCKSFF